MCSVIIGYDNRVALVTLSFLLTKRKRDAAAAPSVFLLASITF